MIASSGSTNGYRVRTFTGNITQRAVWLALFAMMLIVVAPQVSISLQQLRQAPTHAMHHDMPMVENIATLRMKLTRWGIDLHMGVLFGLPNQLLLILFGVGVCTTIVVGYRMWWRRRPAQSHTNPLQTLVKAWLGLRLAERIIVFIIALCLSVALPLMGLSLLVFITLDLLRWRKVTHHQSLAS